MLLIRMSPIKTALLSTKIQNSDNTHELCMHLYERKIGTIRTASSKKRMQVYLVLIPRLIKTYAPPLS